MLNICQVSVKRDIPIILENFKNFKKFYNEIKIFIICPKNELIEFKKKLNYKEFEIINEERLISFKQFRHIFKKLAKKVSYKKKFEKRLNWYYQQILKISFALNFITKNKNLILWDADTIIIKKIIFFEKKYSIKYGTFSEFHREYYITNKAILKKLPNYFISFLVQFSAITYTETNFFKKNILNLQRVRIENANKLSNLILKSIFSNHKIYNGSMFSEFEFIGHSNYLLKKKPQRPILTLRFGLNGKLTNLQINICKILNFKHLTYEHSHQNKFSKGMLLRNQTWGVYFRVIFKSLFKHYLRLPRHYLRYIHYLKSSYGKS